MKFFKTLWKETVQAWRKVRAAGRKAVGYYLALFGAQCGRGFVRGIAYAPTVALLTLFYGTMGLYAGLILVYVCEHLFYQATEMGDANAMDRFAVVSTGFLAAPIVALYLPLTPWAIFAAVGIPASATWCLARLARWAESGLSVTLTSELDEPSFAGSWDPRAQVIQMAPSKA